MSSNHQRYPPADCGPLEEFRAGAWQAESPSRRGHLYIFIYIFLYTHTHTPVEPALAFPTFFFGSLLFISAAQPARAILTGICAHWIVNILNLGLIVLLKGFDK